MVRLSQMPPGAAEPERLSSGVPLAP